MLWEFRFRYTYPLSWHAGLNHVARNRVVHADIATRNRLYACAKFNWKENERVVFLKLLASYSTDVVIRINIRSGPTGSDIRLSEWRRQGILAGQRVMW